jgi:hypothetical protein
MLKKLSFLFAVAAMSFGSVAKANVLLLVDLTVENQVTISATNGNSLATVSGSDTTGVYLENFYSGPLNSIVSATPVAGLQTLGSAENPVESSALFTASVTDPGLNIWSWSPDLTVTFTAGSLAFVGSSTWTLPNEDYLDMLAGNTSGNLYFPADRLADVPNAQLLGSWQVIPEPSSMALLSIGLVGLLRRRR